jgi:hypothetical protein
MKKYLLVLHALFLAFNLANGQYSQCINNDFSLPNELFRKRLKDYEPGFRYGGPYTMFNTTSPGW